MHLLMNIPLATLSYTVASVGCGVMVVAVLILAEFALPEKR